VDHIGHYSNRPDPRTRDQVELFGLLYDALSPLRELAETLSEDATPGSMAWRVLTTYRLWL
jgi:hypothetical protein